VLDVTVETPSPAGDSTCNSFTELRAQASSKRSYAACLRCLRRAPAYERVAAE